MHGVLILWPVAEDFPAGGEIDWMEVFRGDRQEVTVNIHHGPPDRSFGGTVPHDATRWTAWAVEWTPDHITTYADGEEWYSTDRSDLFPPRPMNMTMQLDWFPPDGGGPAERGSAMQMDWAHQWALPESEPATLSLAPGDPATGQPSLYPDRRPRPLPAAPDSWAAGDEKDLGPSPAAHDPRAGREVLAGGRVGPATRAGDRGGEGGLVEQRV